jgi:protein-tyrosine phosphatase
MWRSFDPAAPRMSGSAAVAGESSLDVADPWYGGRDLFVSTLQQVEAAADGVVGFVRRELELRDGSGGHEHGDEQQHGQ